MVKEIPIVVSVLRTVPKSLENGLDELDISESNEASQTTALLKSAWILGSVLETWDLLSLKLQWKATS